MPAGIWDDLPWDKGKPPATASLTATDRNIKTPRLRAPWHPPQCTEPLLLPILSSSSPAKRCTTPLRPAVASPRHDHSPPPRLSADTAPKRRSSPDKLPHCLMQTVTARHVKFIRKLRIYIRNLRLYIRKFRLYIRNLRLYFAIGDTKFMCGVREVCPPCRRDYKL